MSEHIIKTIEDLATQIAEREAEVVRLKKTVNDLCRLANAEPKYGGNELETSGSSTALRSDQFYGRPLATVIREYLQIRRARGQGPASPNAIYDALVSGGYVFETKVEENAKRGLRESLTKNPIFHRLPNNGDYGLLEWYPNAKSEKESKSKKGDAKPEEEPKSAASAESRGSGEASAASA
jgi:hypothetical protein